MKLIKTMPRKGKNITCPQTTKEHTETVLSILTKYPDGLKIEEIAEFTGLRNGVIISALSLLREQGYVESIGYKREIKKLTIDGKTLYNLLQHDDKNALIEFTEPRIEKSKILKTALEIFKKDGNLSQLKLGELIAEQMEVKWKDPATYRMVARSCRDILSLFGLIEHDKPHITRKKVKNKEIAQVEISEYITPEHTKLWYYFTKIFANPNTWYFDKSLKKEMEEIIESMKKTENGSFKYIINSVSRNFELAFKKRDMDHIREASKIYTDFLEYRESNKDK